MNIPVHIEYPGEHLPFSKTPPASIKQQAVPEASEYKILDPEQHLYSPGFRLSKTVPPAGQHHLG